MSSPLDMHYYCPSCISWFTKETRPNLDLVECERSSTGLKEVSHCHCNGTITEVVDAHEDGTITPYDSLKLELYQEELEAIERYREAVIKRIVDITGERP